MEINNRNKSKEELDKTNVKNTENALPNLSGVLQAITKDNQNLGDHG